MTEEQAFWAFLAETQPARFDQLRTQHVALLKDLYKNDFAQWKVERMMQVAGNNRRQQARRTAEAWAMAKGED